MSTMLFPVISNCQEKNLIYHQSPKYPNVRESTGFTLIFREGGFWDTDGGSSLMTNPERMEVGSFILDISHKLGKYLGFDELSLLYSIPSSLIQKGILVSKLIKF